LCRFDRAPRAPTFVTILLYDLVRKERKRCSDEREEYALSVDEMNGTVVDCAERWAESCEAAEFEIGGPAKQTHICHVIVLPKKVLSLCRRSFCTIMIRSIQIVCKDRSILNWCMSTTLECSIAKILSIPRYQPVHTSRRSEV
jgi:hypothetical protein